MVYWSTGKLGLAINEGRCCRLDLRVFLPELGAAFLLLAGDVETTPVELGDILCKANEWCYRPQACAGSRRFFSFFHFSALSVVV